MRKRVGRLDSGRVLPEVLIAPSGNVMKTDEVANAVRLGAALPVEFAKLDRRTVAAGHHRNEPVDLAVQQMEIGPFERLDSDRGVADRNAIAGPGLRPAALADCDLASAGPAVVWKAFNQVARLRIRG